MPKAVMRSGATGTPTVPSQGATTQPAAKPAVPPAKPATPAAPADDMEARLRAMNLPEEAIQAALLAAKNKPAAAAPVTQAPAPAKPATPAPVVQKAVTPPPAAKPVAPPPVAKPTPPPPVAEAPAIDVPVEDLSEAVAPTDATAPADEQGSPTEGMSDAEFAQWQSQQAEQATPPTQTPGVTAPPPDDSAGDDDQHEENRVVVQNHWSEKSKGALSGAIDRSDFKTPQLKLVQGSGDNAAKFGQGKLVFMEMPIFDAPTADKPSPFIRTIPVSLQKYFRENVSQDDKGPDGKTRKPRNAFTPEEVSRLGGTLDFTVDSKGTRIKPSWSPAAKITLLLEQPDGVDHPGFTIPVEVNGKISNWAAAVTYVNGGAYRSMAKPIIDATNFLLVEGDAIVLHKRIWKLQIVTEKSGTNWVFTPKVAITNEPTPADLRALSESLLGSTK